MKMIDATEIETLLNDLSFRCVTLKNGIFYKDEKGKKLLSLYKIKEIDYINIFSLLANEKEE